MKKLEDYLYYHEPGPPDIKIYHGDCLEIMPLLQKVDLVVTDPPYGLNIAKTGMVGGSGKNFIGKLVSPRKYQKSDWDKCSPKDEVFELIMKTSRNQIIFGGNYFNLPKGKKWIVWDKMATGNFSHCELIWTSMNGRIEKFEWEWNGFIQGNGNGGRQRIKREHPSQKPKELMGFLLGKICGDALDPFLGSGTTLVACKELKRNGIGIEINEKYCEIAKKRLQNTQVPFL